MAKHNSDFVWHFVLPVCKLNCVCDVIGTVNGLTVLLVWQSFVTPVSLSYSASKSFAMEALSTTVSTQSLGSFLSSKVGADSRATVAGRGPVVLLLSQSVT